AQRAQKQEETYKYYHNIALAHFGWQTNDLGRMEELLKDCPVEHRGWEWHYLQRLRHGDLFTVSLRPSQVIGVAYSPNGKLLAVLGTHGTVKVLDATTGRVLFPLKGHAGHSVISSPVFSPDGARLAAAEGHKILIWDLNRRQEPLVLRGHVGRV